MSSAPRPSDPQREQLRQQAIQRRQAALDRIVGTRTLVIGGVIAASCVLAGYLDASARSHTTAAAGTAATATGSGTAATGAGSGNPASGQTSSSTAGSARNPFGGGDPPAASSGGGVVVSGGS